MRRRWLPWMVAVAFGVLYAATAAPDLLWSDSAKLLIKAARSDILGFGHGRHPLHALLGAAIGRWLPLPLPYALNLLSAACGAATVGLLAAAGSRWASPNAAAGAAAATGIGHAFWHYATLTESYALLWALLALCLLLAVRLREAPSPARVFTLGAVSGLALAAHGLAAIALAGIWLLARPRPTVGNLLAMVLGASLGGCLLWLPAGDTQTTHEGLGLIRSTVEHAALFLSPRQLPRGLLRSVAFGGYQFFGVAAIALAIGLATAWRSRRQLGWLAAAAAAIVVFASGYFPPRQLPMLGAAWLLLTPFVALGLDRFPERWRWTALVALVTLPPLAYLATSELAARGVVHVPVRDLPLRDEARYFLWPPKRAVDGARRYLLQAERLPPGSVVVCDFNPCEALRYAVEVEGSLDLTLLPVIDDLVLAGRSGDTLATEIDKLLEDRGQIFLADRWEPYYHLRDLRTRFEIDATTYGAFVRVHRRHPPAPVQ